MRRELNCAPFQICGTHEAEGWQFIMLDSYYPGHVGGRLTQGELARLDATLSLSAKHAMVCLHHHPITMRSRWLDTVGLADPDAFWRIIDSHAHVRAVVWGMCTRVYDGQRGNVRLFATPSTGAQFLPLSDRYAVDSRPPAYRSFDLHADDESTRRCTGSSPCRCGRWRHASRRPDPTPMQRTRLGLILCGLIVCLAGARRRRPAFAVGAARQAQHRLSARAPFTCCASATTRWPRPAGGLWQCRGRAHGSEFGGDRLGAGQEECSAAPSCRGRTLTEVLGQHRYGRADTLAREVGVRALQFRSIRALVRRRGHFAAAIGAARLST